MPEMFNSTSLRARLTDRDTIWKNSTINTANFGSAPTTMRLVLDRGVAACAVARADFHAEWEKAVKSHVGTGTITVLSEGDGVGSGGGGSEVFQRPRSFGLEWHRAVEAHREAAAKYEAAKYATAPAPLRLSASWEHLPDPCSAFVDPAQQPQPDIRSDKDKAVTRAIFAGQRQRFIGLITEL